MNKGTLPDSFPAWVWKVARNRYSVWADQKHRRSRDVSPSDIGDYEIEDESENILDEMIYAEQMALLRRELAFIKGSYRNIVVAYYIENKSIREIASSLRLPENTVKSRLFRARELLKEGMDMAREFGKLSYSPEDINFICNGLFGSNGEPWNYLSRTLCKNILLAAYRTPSTAEELAMEIGVALPYMEDELNSLTKATLMKKNGDRYETAFFIVSAETQEKIYADLCRITQKLTEAVIAASEYETEWKNKNCPSWHEGYQPMEDMRWALLMYQADVIRSDTLASFYTNRRKAPKANLGKWGHTLRPNDGEWDVLGMETYTGDRPCFVGQHGCVTSPAEKKLKFIDFNQYKFQYRNIANKTPDSLPHLYAEALEMIAKGAWEGIDSSIIDFLEQHGYITRGKDAYRPAFLVMFKDKKKPMPPVAEAELERLRKKAVDIAIEHYRLCRELIYGEIPDFLKEDVYQIDHACANVFDLRGAVLEEALRIGYISYGENDERRMLGTFMRI